jgi:carbonic anhydrase
LNTDEALSCLVEGNQRYVANKSLHPHQTASRRAELTRGQHPFAAILGCVDSRVPPEIIFDRGLGDLFVVRSAGQVLDEAVIGTFEFGIVEIGIPLLVVLGHSKCGAVVATIELLERGEEPECSIRYLVDSITPAVEMAKGRSGDLVDNAVRINVELVLNRLNESPVLAKAVRAGKLKIVGARYDLDTGAVEFAA